MLEFDKGRLKTSANRNHANSFPAALQFEHFPDCLGGLHMNTGIADGFVEGQSSHVAKNA